MFAKKSIIMLVIAMVAVAATFFISQSVTKAQQAPYTGTTWEYLEIGFSTSVTWSTPLTTGYTYNGATVVPDNPQTTVQAIFNYVGTQGWELVTDFNHQIFIFKRAVIQ